MATGSLILAPAAAALTDNSTSNYGARLQLAKGAGPPSRFWLQLSFPKQVGTPPANGTSNAWWTFQVPTNYASGGTLRVVWNCATAAAGNVRWSSSVGVQTVTAADSITAHAQATATAATTAVPATTANRPVETQIAYTALDAMAADTLVFLNLQRLGADAADTATVDVFASAVMFDYTSS